MSQPFQFKQFNVKQAEGVMKITTDSILLGAWVAAENAKAILDIGTGTGLLALMMAQKNTVACVNAIDLHSSAVSLAQENVDHSPFAGRVSVSLSSLQAFEPVRQFDLIVSNPPYFIADLKAELPHKLLAKHTVELSYEDLLKHINRLLTAEGKACLVIPCFNLALLAQLAAQEKLYITKQTLVVAVDHKLPYLVLLQLERIKKPIEEGQIVIKDLAGHYTAAFREMTKEFYLIF